MNKCQHINSVVKRMAGSFSAKYQPVEYLQSTGTQYIYSSKLAFSSSNTMQFKFKIDALKGNSTGGYICLLGTNSYFQFAYYNKGWSVGNAGVDDNIVIGDVYIGEIKNNTIYINSINKRISRSSNTSSNYIFWNGSTPYSKGGILYYLKKYDSSGVLSLNLIPCIRKSDSKPGLWDTVSKTFFTNQGTGEFLYG